MIIYCLMTSFELDKPCMGLYHNHHQMSIVVSWGSFCSSYPMSTGNDSSLFGFENHLLRLTLCMLFLILSCPKDASVFASIIVKSHADWGLTIFSFLQFFFLVLWRICRWIN